MSTKYVSADPTDPADAIGPSYREQIGSLVEGTAKLLIAVRHNRPDAPVGLEPPSIFVDGAGLRAQVVVPRPDGKFLVLDDFSIDPDRADYGISRITLMPGGGFGVRLDH